MWALLLFGIPLVGWSQAPEYEYEVGIHQQTDLFSDFFDTQQKTSLHLGTTRSFGSYSLRLNRANRFSETGYQTEIEAYPDFGKGYYGYWTYAYSGSSIFSRHRLGVELYSPLPYRSEGSAGLRFLNFGTGAESWIATLSLSHYWHSFLFTVRPYFIFSDEGSGQTYAGLIRYFLNDKNDYLGLRFGGGVATDQDLNQLREGVQEEELLLLKSFQAGLESRYHLTNRLYARLEARVNQQELSFEPGNFVSNWRFIYGLTYKF